MRARGRRFALRQRRRWAGAAVLLAPCALVIGSDLALRAWPFTYFDRAHAFGYVGSAAESALLWIVLLHTASRRRGAVGHIAGALFVALFTLATGVEWAFHSFYNTYLSIDGQIHSTSIPWSLVGTLPMDRPLVIASIALAFGLAVALLALARRLVRPRPWPRRIVPLLVPLALSAAALVPVSYRTIQSTPPDLIYFHGVTALVKERLGLTHVAPDRRLQRRRPEAVPPVSPSPRRPRNVLFIVQESQRADVTCVEYDPACALATRSSNAAVPGRIPLLQMRSNASTTAISISTLWSGLSPVAQGELLHEAPLLWDYAHAAGYDTAYWTSQNVMFGNARLYVQDIPVSHRCVATDLDPIADLDTGARDALLSARVIEEWDELREPFFAVVHYSNIHFPSVYDPANAPFQPAELDKDKPAAFKNYYRDAVYLSDLAVGGLLRHVRASSSGPRTVVVYTSDHGEAFREHGQLGHTTSIYEEEVRVPTWIDAPAGTLAPEEEESLRGAKDELAWHLDMAPTFLDLMGLWDAPDLSGFRGRMMGHPLTRPERTAGAVPLSNCTWVWGCGFRNWGMMLGPLKVEAREWDGEYHCFDVLDDPGELHNLGERGCGPLPELARQVFQVMPNVKPPAQGSAGP